jgi:hypothetical protein
MGFNLYLRKYFSMNSQTKEAIKQQIGSKSLFRKIPQTAAVLSYLSGINELAIESNSGKSEGSFFIAQYPQGILISDKKGRIRLGISYADLTNIEFTKPEDDLYEVAFSNSKHFQPVVFSFQKKNRLNVLSFVKSIPIKGGLDPRDENSAREEILKLKEAFATDYLTDRTFREELKTHEKGITELEINEKWITYADRVTKVAEVSGYTTSIQEVNTYGVSSFQYSIRIYRPDEHLYINFSSVSAFLKQGEFSQVLNRISKVLFDVVSRPIVAKWFDQFAMNETIDSKEFTLSRQGLLLKTKTPNIMIHWDEIVAQPNGLFRWPYSNTVFLKLEASYDHRSNMLSVFIHWLQKDPDRLMALMGRRNYVS